MFFERASPAFGRGRLHKNTVCPPLGFQPPFLLNIAGGGVQGGLGCFGGVLGCVLGVCWVCVGCVLGVFSLGVLGVGCRV